MTQPDDEDTSYCVRSCGRPGLYSLTTGIIAVQVPGDPDPFSELTELVCDPDGCAP